jgi:phosphoribosylanthranilate isomerase
MVGAPPGTVRGVFVKICGIVTEEDALLAVAMGADALGFNFVPGSPRQVTPSDVHDIVKRLPPDTVTIGVFRDERPERVIEVVNKIGLTGAQLHGREPVSEARAIRPHVHFLVHAFAAGDPALAAAGSSPADVILVDSPTPGSGRVFDWSLAEGVPGGVRMLLAGGLDPGNVAEAIRRVRPWGVDVASGVETFAGSGRKDPRKVRAFVEIAREVGDEVAQDGWVPDDPFDAGSAPYDWAHDDPR